ncbi:transaldolase family protein [Cellulomonas sp. KRMCY2]|uniref:transaldolase family protein n=1 Tax=Cellulomonas sp. KRMCY2 TaxID=1304865 RepID=UPI00045E730E|nr:transaldolase family protein [Cellulomonas sp. KRMCY2]
MTLYLDSADRDALAPLLATGLFAGVTTNPLLLARAGLTSADLPALHDWAVAHGARTVFLQTLGTDVDQIVREGENLRALSERVVVKVPATRAGLTATRRLADSGVPLLVTAVYRASQALLAQAAGAQYIAPYLGRMTAAGRSGYEEILAMRRILTETTLEILVASIKDVEAVIALAAAGVPSFTVGPELAAKLLDDDLSNAAAQEFEAIALAGS